MDHASGTPGALLAVLRDGPRTRTDLIRTTGLTRSVVMGLLDQLVDAGLVATAEHPASTGGRPAAAYEFVAGGRLVLAADLGVRHATLAVTDLAGEVLAHKTSTIRIDEGPDAVVPFVVEGLGRMLAELGWDGPIAGVCVGVPGPVEQPTGRPTSPPIMPDWDRFDLVGTLAARFACPVFVDNDANLHALGERALAYPEVDDLIFVKVASGVGAGIIVNGRLAHGAKGAAGDLGHVYSRAAGDAPCRCGNRGCLEAIAGGIAIAQRLTDRGIPADGAGEVASLARAGNLEAIRELRVAGEAIGEVLATCVALLNPGLVVLGGGLATVGEPLISGVRHAMFTRALDLARTDLDIVQARSGRLVAALGAAQVVLDHVLSPEQVNRELGVAS